MMEKIMVVVMNLNHHDGTGRPTILYGDDDVGIAVPDNKDN